MKNLVFANADGEIATVTPQKVDRERLYGRSRTEARDEFGEPAELRALLEDGRTLLAAGSLSSVYLDSAGAPIERDALVPRDAEGRELATVPSSFDGPVLLTPSSDFEVILLCEISTVYALTLGDDAEWLRQALKSETVFRCAYNYYKSTEPLSAFVLNNIDGLPFLIAGTPLRPELTGLNTPPPAVTEDDDDDFDFSMR